MVIGLYFTLSIKQQLSFIAKIWDFNYRASFYDEINI